MPPALAKFARRLRAYFVMRVLGGYTRALASYMLGLTEDEWRDDWDALAQLSQDELYDAAYGVLEALEGDFSGVDEAEEPAERAED